MAGGVWTEPVDVGVEAVPTTLLTAIADDLRCIHKGGGDSSITTIAVDVSNVLDIGTIDDTFLVSGTEALSYISTTGRQLRNKINLIKKTSNSNINYGAGSTPSNTAPIYGNGAGSGSVTWVAERLITLVYDGTAWHHDIS